MAVKRRVRPTHLSKKKAPWLWSLGAFFVFFGEQQRCVGRAPTLAINDKKVQFAIIFSIIKKSPLIFPFAKVRMSLVGGKREILHISLYSFPEKYLRLNLPGFENLAGLNKKIFF
jgi:hypothetical protein